MKKIIEKVGSIGKIIGVIIGIFILWIIFGFISGKQPNNSRDLSIQTKDIEKSDFSENFSMETGSTKNLTNASSVSLNQNSAPESNLSEKKIIKNGNLSLKIEKTEEAANKISEIAKNQEGEVFSTNFYEKTKGQKSGNITIKVPVERFEATLVQIKTVATQVISESTTGQDVTEQYSDLQAQLRNKKAEEQSFVKILDRAGDIEDVLAVTQQISRVRGEIERLAGQIRFMDSRTNMSTIAISLSEDIEITPIQNDWRPLQVIKKSFSDLLNNSQDFVDETIRFIIVDIPSLIPFLLFLGIIYWTGKKLWRKIRN